MSELPRPDGLGAQDGAERAAPEGAPARIFLTGELDSSAAAAVAIQLIAHDGHSDEEVQLLIRSDQGTVSAGLQVMDTIDAMGVPVLGIGLGEVAGPALGVLAVCHRRRAGPNSRLLLSAPGLSAEGTAEQLLEAARQAQIDLERFAVRVARATRQPLEKIEIDLLQGRHFDAAEAVAYRLIDGIWASR